jgi:tetratricopeptide (TPR) repeat protein
MKSPGLLALAVVVACHARAGRDASQAPELPPGAQAISLLGGPLYPPALSEQATRTYAERLREAESAYAHTPGNADSIIWLGRRTAYPGQFQKAIAIFTRGIALHPRDARMYRHRGHRYITTRRFDLAVADLQHAADLVKGQPDQVEPDGLPNARNIPTGTLQFNIWYHLGLAHYLRGDLERALGAYAECMKVSRNPDTRVATTHWMYMTLRRLGREQDAAAVLTPMSGEMDVIEDEAYHRLLLFYKGELPVDSLVPPGDAPVSDVASAYGVGSWYLYNRRVQDAEQLYRRVLATGQWPSFGYIAAEADLVAIQRTK